MAFYLIGSYINSIDDSTMQQLNAMSDPAANIYQESTPPNRQASNHQKHRIRLQTDEVLL